MWYNSLIENILLPLGDAINGTKYITSLRAWRRIQQLPESALEDLQQKKLASVLAHAVEHIPFYRSLRKENASLSIKDFPMMTKAIIRENGDAMLWHPEAKEDLICEKSSGSSGVQGQVYMSRKEQSNVQAVQTLLWEWSGYAPGRPILQTGMTLKRGLVKKLKDIVFRTNYQSAFGLAEGDVLKVLQGLTRDKNSFFGGYASSLYVFAQVAAKNEIDDIQFDATISWGDKMFPHYRKLIERQFKTRVFDTYGTTEGFMIAGQKDLAYYYILSPHVYVEILNEQGEEVPDGEMGYVVVTSLDAYEMPLIRYYLGDLAVKLPRSKYPANRSLNFPLLERIIGRDTDIVRTPSGKSMIVHFFTAIFEHVPEIKQFRIVQRELSSLLVEYIPASDFTLSVLDTIRTKIQEHLKEEFRVHFEPVTEIPVSPSGKPQIIVSQLP